MTERLYYNDSFLREFEAEVAACIPAGDRWQVLLDRTAFYPTSGGQPHDLGRLNEVGVLEVLDRDDGELLHVLEGPIALGRVHGTIDWNRRFDHMQQHTGQHLLSAAFNEKFQFATVSFHLGREISTIDIAAPSVVPRHLEEAERRTNEAIMEDRAIQVLYRTAEELVALGVRKKVDREGILRVVEIEGFDRQPCGGTHLARTGQAGMLLIQKCEKQKQNWRIEFVTGFRALAASRSDRHTLSLAAERIGCGMREVPEMLRKIMEEKRAADRGNQKLLERVAIFEAQSFRQAAPRRSDGVCVVHAVLDDADAKYLRALGAKLSEHRATIAVLASGAGGHVVFAGSSDVPDDMSRLLREALAPVSGKGGGTKSFAQGSVPDGSKTEDVISNAAKRLGI
jgi:alanyl-tRNA synthetase